MCKKKIFQDALSAKSTGTIASYFYKCREFFNWLQQNHCTLTLPINERIIAGFVSHSISKSNSDSVIVTTAAAIKNNPVDSPLVQNIIMGGRKQLHKPPTQKEPVTLGQVRKITEKFATPDSLLMQLRTACYVSLSFVLLFRHDEMSQIKASHIHILPESKGLKIFIPRSKTDVFRDGTFTYVPSSVDPYLPTNILRRYMFACNIEIGQDAFIFTALSFQSRTNSYKYLANRPLSYSRCREIFISALKEMGVTNHKLYGLHSLRSGGATLLAQKGASEESIMNHGRWKSTTSKNRHTKHSEEQRLKIGEMLLG